VLRGVIFDFDGVLVDSEHAHFEALRSVLAQRAAIHITTAEYMEHYLGYDDRTCFRRAFELHRREVPAEGITDLVSAKWEAYNHALDAVPFLPGAIALIVALHEAGIPIAIASGSRRGEIETILRSENLLGRFRGIVSSDDVQNFKPHPEPYLRARVLIGAAESAEGVVVIEDSAAGASSARAARLRVIGVAGPGTLHSAELFDLVVKSLSDLSVADLEQVASRRT
jgi:beta-phosphoglucomutase